MLARSASAGAFLFLFDREEVERFLSSVRRLLERDAEGLLLYTGRRVTGLALVDQRPLAVAGRVVRPGQGVQGRGSGLAGHGHAEGAARFGEARVGGERQIAVILEHGRPGKRVVVQLRAVAFGLFGSLCCLGDGKRHSAGQSLVPVGSMKGV